MNVTQQIRNFIQGISQQPPLVRFPEQLDLQLNGLSTTASGLQKRPPSLFVGRANINIPSNSLVHTIDRDGEEQYVSVFTGTDIQVWDKHGNIKKVDFDYSSSRSYIRTNNPRKDLKVITVADHTFIVNRKVRTTIDPQGSQDNPATSGVLIYIRSGQYGRTYKVQIGTDVFTHTTPNGDKPEDTKAIGLDVIRDQLVEKISKSEYYWSPQQGEAWFYVRGISDKEVKVEDGYNNRALTLIRDKVTTMADLPATAPDGYVVNVTGEAGSRDDDFYVKFNKSKGVWEETLKPDPSLKTRINANTMPHVMKRLSDGTFRVEPCVWENRLVGDDESNPVPSFVGQYINDLFFYRNRLGLIAGENVCLSRSGNYFDFWVGSATEIQDTDPIDLGVSHNKVSILYNAIPFNEDLYLFSTSTQFILSADGILSPKNARLTQATEFSNDKDVVPVGAGKNLYFSVPRSNFTSIREYFAVKDALGIKDAVDITAHVPNLIPNSVYKIASSNTENMLVVQTDGNKSSLYIYKYLYSDDTRVQASWSEWTFDGDVVGADFIGSDLYVVLTRNTGDTTLERLSMTSHTTDYTFEPYRVHLDCKTTMTVPNSERCDVTRTCYKGNMKRNLMIVLDDGRLFSTDANGCWTDIPKDAYEHKAFVGIPYIFKMRLTKFFIKKQDESGTTTIPDYRLMLRKVWFSYYLTGYLRVLVKSEGKDTYEYVLNGHTLGVNTNRLDTMPIETGVFSVPVHGRNTTTTLEVINDTPLPSSVVGGGWEANVTQRFRNI